MYLKGRTFRISMNKAVYGSEHKHEALVEHDGKQCTLGEEIRPGLYLTNLDTAHEDSDYAHGGKLLVMPTKDGILHDAKPPRKARKE